MNIIIIAADSLRVDHLGCYGSSVKTPNIDEVASDAAVFEQAYAENLPTVPCRTAWWTGRHLFAKRGWQPFEHDDVLLAEILSSRGFASALITDTYHLHRPSYNCGRGFDTTCFIRGQEYDPWVVDESLEVDITKHHRLRGDDSDDMWKQRFTQYLKNATRFKTEEDHCVARVMKEAIRWLEHMTKSRQDKLFLWVDSFSPHEPWDPPSPYREMYKPGYTGMELIDPVPGDIAGYMTEAELDCARSLYAGVVTLSDKWIGILLDAVRNLGIYENSLIVITSDHGEPFGEHGMIRKAKPSLYEELVHIPLIIRHPECLGIKQRFDTFTQPPDLMPTLLDAVGIDAKNTELGWPGFEPKDPISTLTGRSLLPILSGEIDSLWDFAVSAYYARQWSIRTKKWAYLMNLEGEDPPELYHRLSDSLEQQNVFDANLDIADTLELRLRRFADEVS